MWRNTTWKPFHDHELKNYPYVGAFNIETWTNWNILRPYLDKSFDSDGIIEDSQYGKKRFRFDLHKKENSTGNVPGEDEVDSSDLVSDDEGSDKKKPICNVRGLPNEMKKLNNEELNNEDHSDILESQVLNPQPEDTPAEVCDGEQSEHLNQTIQIDPMEQEENFHNILKEFAKQNALKVIHLSEPEGDRFVSDITSAENKLPVNELNFERDSFFRFLLDDFPEEMEAV